ncbi:MAG TPA: TIGR03435 family protein [Bryobacteraceae bacterium]|nr:TIGR03435 family protein [Bryobacteraceae bacterium]
MKTLMLWIVTLAALSGGALFAQTMTGTWQGALKVPQAPNGELRIVIKISVSDADRLKAEMFSIDQGAQPIPATTVTQSGSTLKITVAPINGNYEGKLSADGATITGTWTQGAPLPLTLVKATPETTWTIPEPPPPPKMMDEKAKPEFEVATIKPSDPNRRGWGITVNRSGMLNTLNTNLSDLIKFAYDMHPKQVVGAPEWVDTDKFDISAKPNIPGMPSVNQMKAMLQKLLADRFSLKFHHEKKELSVYAITVAKGGEKIKKEENSTLPIPGFGGIPQRGFNVRNGTIAEFASVMQAQFMEQPVVDQTGLGDTRYTFVLKWTPDPSQRSGFGGGPPPDAAPPAPDADAPPDLFSAMQQQLGLKMGMTKAPVEVMVIDKVDKPSEN